MNQRPKFNIRIYGLCLKEGHLLALHEMYAGQKLLKLPGGGLEFGEGALDCLKREFLEELNLEVSSVAHFYTQEEFVVSLFDSSEQLFTVYYTCEVVDQEVLTIREPSIEKTEWISLQEENPFKLPIDKKVFDLLKTTYL